MPVTKEGGKYIVKRFSDAGFEKNFGLDDLCVEISGTYFYRLFGVNIPDLYLVKFLEGQGVCYGVASEFFDGSSLEDILGLGGAPLSDRDIAHLTVCTILNKCFKDEEDPIYKDYLNCIPTVYNLKQEPFDGRFSFDAKEGELTFKKNDGGDIVLHGLVRTLIVAALLDDHDVVGPIGSNMILQPLGKNHFQVVKIDAGRCFVPCFLAKAQGIFLEGKFFHDVKHSLVDQHAAEVCSLVYDEILENITHEKVQEVIDDILSINEGAIRQLLKVLEQKTNEAGLKIIKDRWPLLFDIIVDNRRKLSKLSTTKALTKENNNCDSLDVKGIIPENLVLKQSQFVAYGMDEFDGRSNPVLCYLDTQGRVLASYVLQKSCKCSPEDFPKVIDEGLVGRSDQDKLLMLDMIYSMLHPILEKEGEPESYEANGLREVQGDSAFFKPSQNIKNNLKKILILQEKVVDIIQHANSNKSALASLFNRRDSVMGFSFCVFNDAIRRSGQAKETFKGFLTEQSNVFKLRPKCA